MLHRRMKLALRMAAAAATVALGSGFASTITYSSLAAFQAAATLPAGNNITFEYLAAPGGQAHFDTSNGLKLGTAGNQLQFLGCSPSCDSASSYALTVDNTSAGNWNFWGPTSPNSVLHAFGGVTYVLQVNPLVSSTAIGFDVMTAYPAAQNVSITVVTSSGSQSFGNVATQSNPTEQFWGVTTDTPILSLAIQAPTANHVFLDNVLYGQSNAQAPPEVPEALSSLLIGSGLVVLWALRKLVPARLTTANRRRTSARLIG